MNLVILDGFTLCDKKTMQQLFSDLAEVTAYDRTKPEEVYERICKADMVLTNKVVLSNDVLERCPKLQYVGVLATGYNVVDLTYATDHNIVVTNIPAYSTASVVQHVFALLLAMTSHVKEHSQAVLEGQWCSCPDFTFLKMSIFELAGKTMGVIGMGSIGVSVSRVASAFGMKVLAYSRHKKDLNIPNLTWCDLDTLFQNADVITVHAPLNDQTRQLICQKTLQQMKPSALFINTSRGPIVCEQELADALNKGQIAGAAVDVVCTEPMREDNPLLQAKNIVITPHIAWATNEAKERLLAICHQNIEAFLAGKPQNKVNASSIK